MAIPQFSKLVPGVRFSLPAPIKIKRPSGAFYFYREGNRVVFQKYELLHVFENPGSGGEILHVRCTAKFWGKRNPSGGTLD